MSPAPMYSKARSTASRYRRGIVFDDRGLQQSHARVGQARRCSQVRCDARDQVGGGFLSDDPTATAVVFMYHCGRNANRLRDRTDSRLP
jgi:hypothetical protein